MKALFIVLAGVFTSVAAHAETLDCKNLVNEGNVKKQVACEKLSGKAKENCEVSNKTDKQKPSVNAAQ